MDSVNELPEEFDLIVIGTGLTESIFAAAASRSGKNVLHIDSNSFYGGSWASYNLETIQELSKANERVHRIHNLCADNGKLILDGAINCIIENAESSWHIPSNALELDNKSDDEKMHEQEAGQSSEPANVWTKDKVMENARRYNIDLTPKLLYSRGDLVELLISSNISRYAEFRAVDRVLTKIDDEIKPIPCSKADVFNSKHVSILEKRLLMKVLTIIDKNEDDMSEFQDKTFHQYLVAKNLKPNLIHYILYAIGLCDDQTSCLDGVESVRKFLGSLCRYGNTPFIYPMYGCGEMPQCFCRLCAVFGGTYCLNRTLQEIHFNESFSEFQAIKCNDQLIRAKHLVISGCGLNRFADFFAKASHDHVKPHIQCGKLSRAIYITDKPLCNQDASSLGGVEFLKIPTIGVTGGLHKNPNNGAFVIQSSHWSGTTPNGLYLVHITCQSRSDTARADIALYEQTVFDNGNSKILWSMYYNIPSCLVCSESVELPHNFHATCGPYFELDYDESVKQAKKLFEQFYGNEDFLPRAPDPDEIVDDDKDATEPSPDLVAELMSKIHTNDETTPTETNETMEIEEEAA